MTNMMGETTCPACGETFVLDDGKDERKYRNHLEQHLKDGLKNAIQNND